MNLNGPNRWDDQPVTPAPTGFLNWVMTAGVRFLALPRGAQAAIAIVALLLVAGLVGTVLGWAFWLLAMLGRVLLITLVVAFVLSWLKKQRK